MAVIFVSPGAARVFDACKRMRVEQKRVHTGAILADPKSPLKKTLTFYELLGDVRVASPRLCDLGHTYLVRLYAVRY